MTYETQTPDTWQWWAGSCEELYTDGPFDTREEAVCVVKSELCDEGGWITEAIKHPLDLSDVFDVDRLLEAAEEHFYECAGESYDLLFDVTSDQKKTLEDCVKSAITKWQKDNGIIFSPWTFSGQRNTEWIAPEVDP